MLTARLDIRGLTIPLPFGAANYGEAVKKVVWRVGSLSTR